MAEKVEVGAAPTELPLELATNVPFRKVAGVPVTPAALPPA